MRRLGVSAVTAVIGSLLAVLMSAGLPPAVGAAHALPAHHAVGDMLIARGRTTAVRGTILRVGGAVTRIDAARHTLSIDSATLGRRFTVEVNGGTMITLSQWPAGFGDVVLGDHLTVTGVADPVHAVPGPNLIIAARIRLGSPRFEGIITRIDAAAERAVTLTVRPRHGHVVRIDAPASATVTHGDQTARPGDLVVGLEIGAHGRRVDKFELLAATIRVRVHHHAVGGAVTSLARGLIRLVNARTGRRFTIRLTSHTRYTWAGKPVTAARLQTGMPISAHGYDALRDDQRGVLTMIADHVTVLVRQRIVGGTVVGVDRGIYHIVDTYYGSQFTIHGTAQTRYTAGGKPATAVVVQVGAHIRVHGYDAPHNDRQGVLAVIATLVDVVGRASHPRLHTIAGTVVRLDRGIVRLASATDGSAVALQVGPRTRYTLHGKPVAAATLQVGMPVRAHVYAPLGASLTSATVIADRVELLVREHTLSGTALRVAPGVITLEGKRSGDRVTIHLTARTLYLRYGKLTRAAALRVGVYIRVHGYDTGQTQSGTAPANVYADRVEVVLYYHTLSGSVVGITPGALRLATVQDGSPVTATVQLTAHTRYSRAGKPIALAALRAGMVIRAHGYDVPQRVITSTPPVLADRIDVIVLKSHARQPAKVPGGSPTPTITSSPTVSPALTATPTATGAPASSLGPAPPTVTPTAMATVTPTASATTTPSPAPSPTPTASATATPTPTASATATPTPTASATASPTIAPTATASPTMTATATPTMTP